MSSHVHRTGWLSAFLISWSLGACTGGGAPGAGFAGGPQALDNAGTSLQGATGTGVGDAAANIPMPDIAVGPSTDIVEDPDAPRFGFRVVGGGTPVCLTTENPFAFALPGGAGFAALRSLLLPSAMAEQSQTDYGPLSDSIANHNSDSAYVNIGGSDADSHFLKVTLAGQVQYNVNGGDYKDWKTEGFEGERYLRIKAANRDYRDVLIGADGKISLPFIFRMGSAPTPASFAWFVDHLVIYRATSAFTHDALNEQKKCGETGFCFAQIYVMKLGPFTPDPQAPAPPDFATLPACPTE